MSPTTITRKASRKDKGNLMNINPPENIKELREHFRAIRAMEGLCTTCGADPYCHVDSKPYCRACAWQANGGHQPPDDPDNEPPGAGADPYGRPDPLTHPEYWTE